MGALSFLLGINLIMLSAHAAVHFTSEVLQGDGVTGGEDSAPSSLLVPPVMSTTSSLPRGDVVSGLRASSLRSREREGEIETGKEGSHKETESIGNDLSSTGATAGGSKKRCPLCMDQVTHPAAPLCGHVFCWVCIHTWINTHSNNQSHSHSHSSSSRSSSSDIKCPVCRCLFKREAVRPLFGFS